MIWEFRAVSNCLGLLPHRRLDAMKASLLVFARGTTYMYICYLSKGSASQGGVFPGLFQGDYLNGSLKEEHLLEIGIEGLLVTVPHHARACA
jgi:hypothetical protein